MSSQDLSFASHWRALCGESALPLRRGWKRTVFCRLETSGRPDFRPLTSLSLRGAAAKQNGGDRFEENFKIE